MKYMLGLVAAFCMAAPALGGGSIEWSKMAPLLAQDPALRSLVHEALEVSSGGMANRFGWMHPLGGARISPYHFDARRKGVDGPYDLELTICTVPTFFDQAGKPTTWDAAHSFTERLSFIAINEKGKETATCPDWVGDA